MLSDVVHICSDIVHICIYEVHIGSDVVNCWKQRSALVRLAR